MKVIGWFDEKGNTWCTDHVSEADKNKDMVTVIYDNDPWAGEAGICTQEGCSVLIADLAIEG